MLVSFLLSAIWSQHCLQPSRQRATLASILRHAGLTVDDLRGLL